MWGYVLSAGKATVISHQNSCDYKRFYINKFTQFLFLIVRWVGEKELSSCIHAITSVGQSVRSEKNLSEISKNSVRFFLGAVFCHTK